MKPFYFLAVLVPISFVAGCAHSVAPIDLRVPVAPPPADGQAAHIRSIHTRAGQGARVLPEGRCAADLVREVLTDDLHKKGYIVGQQQTGDSIGLDVEILNFGIRSEHGRLPPNKVIAGIAIMGMATVQGRSVQYTTFPIEVLISGEIFDSGYGYVGSKVYLMKGQEYPEFANAGLSKFREAVHLKIPRRDGTSQPPKATQDWEAMSKRAAQFESEAAEIARVKVGAEAGNADDQLRLANLLYAGSRHKLLAPDRVASEKWLRAAGEQGHGEALHQLFYRKARPHNESQTTPQNLDEAEEYLRLAALSGNVSAQVFLGSMFYESLDNPDERQNLFLIWTNQRDSPRFSKRFTHDNARAFAWMNLAAAQAEANSATGSRIPAIHSLAIKYRDALARSMGADEKRRGENIAEELAAEIAAHQK